MLNPIAYRLGLLVELEHVHNMFHVSQHRKYIPDRDHVLVTDLIEVIKNLSYEERPI